MNWEHWVFLVFAVAALAAVGYFAMREESPPTNKKPKENKEPSFTRPPTREQTDMQQNGMQQNDTAKDIKDITANNDSAATKSSPAGIAKPQGMLPVEDFVPPSLPPVPEDILPLEMCYAVGLYGKREVSMVMLGALQKAIYDIKKQNNYLLGFDAAAEQWRLSPEMECQHWFIAVPLADRGGAMDEKYIQRIEEQTRIFAQKAAFRPVFPPPYKALEDAAHIDRFCATVDMFIELRLAGDKQPDARVDEVMKLTGMITNGERAYVCRINSETWFSGKLMPTPASGGRQIFIFEMDAPNVSDPPRAFDQMLNAATRATRMLDMKITDPQGAPIDESRTADMRKQLVLLTSQMREFGAAPGGAIARLIFS